MYGTVLYCTTQYCTPLCTVLRQQKRNQIKFVTCSEVKVGPQQRDLKHFAYDIVRKWIQTGKP